MLCRWFHGKLAGGRITSERLLKDFNGPDGSFLVRESDTFMGDYTLSFWYSECSKFFHCVFDVVCCVVEGEE